MRAAATKRAAAGTTAFAQALAKTESPFRYAAVNVSTLESDCQAGIAAAARLHAYRGYVAQTRAYKATGAGEPAALVTQALAEAQRALADVHVVANSALSTFGSLSRGGALVQLAGMWRDAVAAAGSVSTLDLWQHWMADSARRDSIKALGLDDAMLAVVDDTVRMADLHVRVDGDRLVVSGRMNGADAGGTLRTSPRPVRATSALDLLTRSRFDALSATVASGGPAHLSGVPLVDGEASIEDVALYGSLGAQREALLHVRKLEDTGVPAVEGAGSLAAWVVVLLVIAIIGIALQANCGHPDALGREDDSCTFGKFLDFLAVMIILIFAGEDYKQKMGSTNLALGTVLVDGALTDFQTGVRRA